MKLFVSTLSTQGNAPGDDDALVEHDLGAAAALPVGLIRETSLELAWRHGRPRDGSRLAAPGKQRTS